MQDQDKEFEDDFDDLDFGDADGEFEEDLDEEELTDEDLDFLEEETDFSEEEWDEEGFDGEEGIEAEQHKSGKKKGSLNTNMLAIVGAVVIGGGIMLWTFAQPEPDKLPEDIPHQSTLTPQGQVNNPVTVPAKEAKQHRVDQENEFKEGGFLKNPLQVDKVKKTGPETDTEDPVVGMMQEPTPPMPAPIAQEAPDTGDDALIPMPGFAQDQMSDNSLPVPRMPDVSSMEDVPEEEMSAAELLERKIAERQLALAEDSQTDQPAPESLISETEDDGFGLVEEDMSVSHLSGDNNAMETELTDISQATPGPKIEALQEELDSTKEELESLRLSSAEEIAALNTEIDTLKKKLAEKPAKVTANKAPRKTSVKPKPSPQKSWELRAAMPNKAWVSEKGMKEMRSVVVGDTLSGIGKITAITYENGIWVVQGTNGKIQQ